MPVWHSVRPRQTRANNQEKVELSLSFRALEIMEIAKEEKSYYSQALGTHNLTWGVCSTDTNCLARTLCQEATPVTWQALLIHLSHHQSSPITSLQGTTPNPEFPGSLNTWQLCCLCLSRAMENFLVLCS